MTWEDMAALTDAVAFADERGLPLTALVTISWQSAPGFSSVHRSGWEQEHKRFIGAMTRFLKKHGVVPAYVYARECIIGMGSHAHFLVHVPPARWKELKRPMQQYLSEACRRWGYTNSRAVLITGSDHTSGMGLPQQRLGALVYLFKSMNPSELIQTGAGVVPLHKFLGVEPKPHAPLPCKRVGWSENIGVAARKASGWKDHDDVLSLARSVRGRA
jgi:hypothetical protein